MSDSYKLLAIARDIAENLPDFQVVKGPGHGDHATSAFMATLRVRALDLFGHDYSEKRLCGDTSFAVDFYLPHEGTIIEVALGLPNPASEYEKDVLKAIIAKEYGSAVSRLLFISRAGAIKKCDQPGRSIIAGWALAKHQVLIEVHELPGEPRRRIRSSPKRNASIEIAPPVA